MATITINITGSQLNRVLNAIAHRYHYSTRKLEGETKGQFARRWLIEHLKETVIRHDGDLAEQNAIDNAEDTGIS